MPGIVIHKCPKRSGADFADNYGWDLEEIPLQTDISRRTGLPKHAECPFCGAPTKDMKPANPEDAVKLERNLKARGSTAAPQSTTKAENAQLLAEIRALRREMDALKGGKK